jgi:hypothetical protein
MFFNSKPLLIFVEYLLNIGPWPAVCGLAAGYELDILG